MLSCVQLFVTPRTVTHQATLTMGFSRQAYWSGWPFPSPGELPDPGIKPGSPALKAYLPSVPQRKTKRPLNCRTLKDNEDSFSENQRPVENRDFLQITHKITYSSRRSWTLRGTWIRHLADIGQSLPERWEKNYNSPWNINTSNKHFSLLSNDKDMVLTSTIL